MKILFFLLGSSNQASSRVRGFWVIDALQERGVNCKALTGDNVLAYLACACLIVFYDALILQKRYGRWDYHLLKFARFLGKVTIFDLDDKYSQSDDSVTLKNLVRIVESTTAVTVGSRALLEFASSYKCKPYLLPTCVKIENYYPAVDKQSEQVVLGWIGNGRHYKDDLINTLRTPLEIVAAQHNVVFKLIGACGEMELYETFGAIQGLTIDFIDELNWSDQDEIARALSDFDVGLYPLKDNDFNRHKCGFKALEYMAMSIPVISSPVGANADIISDGIDGFLAENQTGWEHALEKLTGDRCLRTAMGAKGRQKVEQQYDVSKHAEFLLGILRDSS